MSENNKKDVNNAFLSQLKEKIHADSVELFSDDENALPYFDEDASLYIVATWGSLQIRYSYNVGYYIEMNFVDIVANSLLWGRRMVE